MERWALPTPHFRGAAAERAQRAWRWCVRRTERDARLAAARGHPIAPPNLRRMRQRREAWIGGCGRLLGVAR